MKVKLNLAIALLFIAFNSNAQWQQVNGIYGGEIRCMAVSGSNIFAGAFWGGGVFLSTNNGSSWTAVNNGLTNKWVLSIAANGPNIFVGTEGGLFLSTNSGNSWTHLANGLPNLHVTALAIYGIDIYAGTEGGGVYLSSNNGANWVSLSVGAVEDIQTIAISGSTIIVGTINYFGTGGVYLSTNNGTTWNQANIGIGPPSNEGKSIIFSGSNIIGAIDGVVYMSINNGTTWTYIGNGIPLSEVLSVAANGSTLFAGTKDSGMYLSTNNGTSWTAINNGLPSYSILSIKIIGTNIFAGTASAGVYLSSNNGSTWNSVNNGLISSTIKFLDMSGSTFYAGTFGGEGLYQSTNNGVTWIAINNGLTNRYLTSFAQSGSSLFVGTSGGVFYSSNNGNNWSAVNNGLSDLNIYSMAASGANVFAGTYSGGVFLSANNGNSWTAVNNGLTCLSINALLIKGTDIFAGTGNCSGGAFISTNNGSSWNLTGSYQVNAFSISDSVVYMGTVNSNSGVHSTINNGTVWHPLSTWYNGLTRNYITSIASDSSNVFAASIDSGVYFSSNYGGSWNHLYSGFPNNYLLAIALKDSIVFAGTQGSGIWTNSSALNGNCSAHFTLNPTATPHVWNAVNQATGLAPLTYIWDWDDFSNSNGPTPSHTYSTPGYYNICLSIVDASGCASNYCDSSTYVYRGLESSTIITVNVITTGVNEILAEDDVMIVSPNPSTNYCTISAEQFANASLTLFDLTGRTISQQSFNIKATIDISQLTNSIYIVEVKDKNGNAVRKKLVKQ